MFTFFRDSVGRRGELQTLAGPPAASHPRGPVSGSSRRERVESGGTRSRVEATTTSPPAFPCAPSGGGSSECVTTRLCSPREDPLSAQPAAFSLAPAATPPAAHHAYFRPASVGRGHPLRRSAAVRKNLNQKFTRLNVIPNGAPGAPGARATRTSPKSDELRST
jgi:hypothetical protein